MNKRNRIIYWISTIWLALGMLSTGFVQLFDVNTEGDYVTGLHYPSYVSTLLGIWKILGVAAILAPRMPLLKEWAYAGFFFAMSGAVFSHMSAGDPASDMLPSMLLLVLTILSWTFRPADRKLISVQPK